MSGTPNALLSDLQARAERRRTQTRDAFWHDLVRSAWERAQGAPPAIARMWLERAHRMLPKDGLVLSALATATLQDGDLVTAERWFRQLATGHGSPEGWAGLALCAHLRQDGPEAVAAMAQALQRTAPTAPLMELADAIVLTADRPGWCGLFSNGMLAIGRGRPGSVLLDSRAVRLSWRGGRATLPSEWSVADRLEVRSKGVDWIGSPLPIGPLTRLEGFIQEAPDGVSGWAWHPGDPERNPAVLTHSGTETSRMTLTEADETALQARPLGRPRRFFMPRGPGLVTVTDEAGRHIWGSPLSVGLEQRVAAALVRGQPAPAPGPVHADRLGRFEAVQTTQASVAVVIPVYRGLIYTRACLDSVVRSVPQGTRVIVVDDCSPEPAMMELLGRLHAAGQIELLRLPSNRGFPGAVNAGLAACPEQDIVLLNSDTLVPPGWLERLRAAAYASPNTGTATPLSNDATILSYPDPEGGNPVPDAAACEAMDRLAQRANGKQTVEIPTGIGFCLYLRHDCLAQVGPLREDVFAQGYGEENDFCMRARALGWRHVGVTGVFVAHVGGQSFGAARDHLIRRNLAILNRLHPGYDALIAQHVAADPLAPHRRRMDEALWTEGGRARAVVLITHAGGGGVDVMIAARCAALAQEGAQGGVRAIVLRPAPGGCRVDDPDAPNLRYAIPTELPALARLLRSDRIMRIELHHRLGHAPEIMDLAAVLKVPWEVYVHDYAWFCQRIALVGPEQRYCGEPDLQGCAECVADLGTLFEEDIAMPDLVARSALDLGRAQRVIAPSRDTAQRIARHFPGVRAEVQAWEDDAHWPPLHPSGAVRKICVVGAIGREKGYDVLLGCVRDARRRALPLEFVVVGYTADDPRLLDAGPAWITGEFAEADAVALIAAQRADLAFIPSIWPETWCFALSRAWAAGLAAVSFDLGAQAERIRTTGRGFTLPLGLRPPAINDALLALAPGR